MIHEVHRSAFASSGVLTHEKAASTAVRSVTGWLIPWLASQVALAPWTPLRSPTSKSRAAEPALTAVTDRPTAPRGSIPVGAFAFNRSATDLISGVDRALQSYLGSQEHLAMMGRYGFSADQLEPILP